METYGINCSKSHSGIFKVINFFPFMSDGLLGKKKEKISSVINNGKFFIFLCCFALILCWLNRKTEWCARFVYTKFNRILHVYQYRHYM